MKRNKNKGTYGRGGLLKAQSLGELRQEGIDAGYDVDAGINEYMSSGSLDSAVDAGGGDASDAAMIDSYGESNYNVDLDPNSGGGLANSYVPSYNTPRTNALAAQAYATQPQGNGTPMPGAGGTPMANSGYNYMTPTPGPTADTTRIGDRFMRRAARKEGRNLMREMRQDRRNDRREHRQADRVDRRDSRIEGRTARRDARQDARQDRQATRQDNRLGRQNARTDRMNARQDRRTDRKGQRQWRRSM